MADFAKNLDALSKKKKDEPASAAASINTNEDGSMSFRATEDISQNTLASNSKPGDFKSNMEEVLAAAKNPQKKMTLNPNIEGSQSTNYKKD